MTTAQKPAQKRLFGGLPFWTIGVPAAAWILFAGSYFIDHGLYRFVSGIGLAGSVITSVYHAELIAQRIGEPFGTLVLAMAVTLIEVALIVSLMLSGGPDASTLARDTVFATVMIILTGIMGLCLLAGGVQHGEQSFNLEGAAALLVTLAAITILTLILPNYTVSVPGPYYEQRQLAFIAVVSLALYGTFILVQSVRHRYFFVPPDPEKHVAPEKPVVASVPTVTAGVLLVISLAVVVVLAKTLAPSIEALVTNVGAPKALVGILIACIVLLPEGSAAFRAARNNELQKSINLALGSALASIGLTIPAVALMSIFTGLTLTLGIDIRSTVLLVLSLFISTIALSTGHTTILQGAVLLVIFAVYLFTTIVP